VHRQKIIKGIGNWSITRKLISKKRRENIIPIESKLDLKIVAFNWLADDLNIPFWMFNLIAEKISGFFRLLIQIGFLTK
jgi:hypothetical protein